MMIYTFFYKFLILKSQMLKKTLSPLKNQKQNHQDFSPVKEMRKLKVQLSDRRFELKKMEQDFAEEKVKLHMNFNAQRNSQNTMIKELIDKMNIENQQWTRKVDEIRQDRDVKIYNLNQEWKAKLEERVLEQKNNLDKKYGAQILELQQLVSSFRKQNQDNKKNYETDLQKNIKIYEERIQLLEVSHGKKIKEVTEMHKKQEQQKVNGLLLIRNIQQKRYDQIKKMLKEKQQQSELSMKEYQSIISKLYQEIHQLKHQIEKYKNKNQNLQDQKRDKEVQAEYKFQSLQKQFQIFQKDLERQWKGKISSLNEKWKAQYRKLQDAYQVLQRTSREKEKIWEDRGRKVLEMYEKRQAREEDVKIIEHLEVQLIRKEFQLEREKQQLRSCKLELDNMDEIYRRIFYSAQKNNRQSTSFHLKKIRLPGIVNRSTNPVKNTMES